MDLVTATDESVQGTDLNHENPPLPPRPSFTNGLDTVLVPSPDSRNHARTFRGHSGAQSGESPVPDMGDVESDNVPGPVVDSQDGKFSYVYATQYIAVTNASSNVSTPRTTSCLESSWAS